LGNSKREIVDDEVGSSEIGAVKKKRWWGGRLWEKKVRGERDEVFKGAKSTTGFGNSK